MIFLEGLSEIPEGHAVKYYEWTEEMTNECQAIIEEDEKNVEQAGIL